MIPPIRRITVVEQTADALRLGIEKREWRERLPAELELAKRLGVSRHTLRAAMQVLAREGLLRRSNGRRAEILLAPRVSRRFTKKLVVGILSPDPALSMRRLDPYHEPVREQIQSFGFQVEFHAGARFYGRRPGNSLENLIRETRVDCWVLLHSTAELQRWFSRRDIPAIVEGTCHQDIRLPALDADYQAISRHATGTLLGLGHRHIALLLPRSRAGGVLRTEQGFHEAIANHQSPGVRGCVIRAEPGTGGVIAAMQRGLSRKQPVTAFVTDRPSDTLTVLTGLFDGGFRVPRDISLIALSDSPFLEHLVPSLARYAFTPELYAKQLTQMISRLVRRDPLANEQRFVFPAYRKGDSVGPCRIA